MKIIDVQTDKIRVPLNKPFKTALRSVTEAESVIVAIRCDDGTVGIGEAPPTAVITGDTTASIEYAIMEIIRPRIIGLAIEQRAQIDAAVNHAIRHNSSAKAAIDIAVYDCLARAADLPLFQLLGGARERLETDYTVSVNPAAEMAEDALQLVRAGFTTLKIKVGNSTIDEDITRVETIRRAVGRDVKLRLDANQGWRAKEAIHAIHRLEALELDIELVEQPVAADDFDGMKAVCSHVTTPIMADESIFSAREAARLLAMHGCDMVNIKLMKCGGITGALQINALAEAYGIPCMVGCMVESGVSVSAACHVAAACTNVTRCDLDTPLMFAADPVSGGARYNGKDICLPSSPGLGINSVTCIGGVIKC
ncbi:MAG: dipeptide epimerase [Sporolactobacillus sp.]